MPHLIDRETGLCSVCQRLQIAAIKEGKKYKRQTYDVRKLAIHNLTSKSDPNYKAIIDRHYVKYKDSFDEYKNAHRKPSIEYGLRPTFMKKLSLNNGLVYGDLSEESDNYEKDQRLTQRSKHRNNYDYREVLRKVNLTQVTRLNERSGKNLTRMTTSRGSNNDQAKNYLKQSEIYNNGYHNLNRSQIKLIDRKNQQDKEYFEDNGETKVYYLNDLENSGYIYNDSELILTPIVYQSLPSIYWNQFE